ncbi:MAG: MGH1-like glycoside hydrolase domain-containing protein [Microthrixaceae bacterium]
MREATPWYHWGPYVAERAWGTVREDYSDDGDAWAHFPHDHARSRAYRWSEDGMAAVCDSEQRLCMGLALWNGRDPILKERMFGLANEEGNHGEDVKEYWWYLDAVPSHSWSRWRYHYPQAEFPYRDLIDTNAARGRDIGEYELLDTGVFDDDRYWVVEVDHAKADPDDLIMCIRVTNVGPDAATLHVLPHLWFRNTWSWDHGATRRTLRATSAAAIEGDHPRVGPMTWSLDVGPDGAAPELLFCENETNTQRLYESVANGPYVKDGINDHVVDGATSVNPDRIGSKAAAWYRLDVEPGATATVRVRLRPSSTTGDPFADADDVLARREAEADEFYDELLDGVDAEQAAVARQAFAGMLCGKQFYNYDVRRWLAGDPTQPPPPPERRHGRNSAWRHVDARDLLSMPDPWEYPWFASWDLAFHTVPLAHLDPAFAKYQLLGLCREWFQHPNGAIPAYEWDFSDVNPPVLAWAALEVFEIDGRRDHAFLARLLPKLLANFAWWVNRQDPEGNNVFSGGFLGLDNISAVNRSILPADGTLEQSDGTAWMAFYALSLMQMSVILAREDDVWVDLAVKFVEHFTLIVDAMQAHDLWNDEDGFFYDVFRTADGTDIPIPVRSMVGVLPLLAMIVVDLDVIGDGGMFHRRFQQYLERHHERGELSQWGEVVRTHAGSDAFAIGLIPPGSTRRVLRRLFDPTEFLSPNGLRSLSKYHEEHPVHVDLAGVAASADYEPGESTTAMFGGNSNWRGPVWMPVNVLILRSLQRYASVLGSEATFEYPTGSDRVLDLDECVEDLRRRLIGLFLRGEDGRRPSDGPDARYVHDPNWRDQITFSEYFHGDDGRGLGASHQTGWTGLVADLIVRPDPSFRRPARP